MEGFLKRIEGLTRFLYVVGGVSLLFIMFLTISDVVLRFMKRPIVGTYELVCFGGALVIGFSLPYVSWRKGHIYVDFLIKSFSRRIKNGFNYVTRSLGIVLFILAGWNLIKYALDIKKSGEVSPTLELPYYPFIFAVGICCFVECLSLVGDIWKIWREKNE